MDYMIFPATKVRWYEVLGLVIFLLVLIVCIEIAEAFSTIRSRIANPPAKQYERRYDDPC